MPRVSGKQDKNQLLATLGGTLRARRKVLSMSQEELANRSGIDRSHMGKIERGERNVTLLNLARIAEALDMKPSEILSDSGF